MSKHRLSLLSRVACVHSTYRDTFECRRPHLTMEHAKTFEDYHKIYTQKEEFSAEDYITIGASLCVRWFKPRRTRTGLERVYCVLSYGNHDTGRVYYIGHCGGTGLCKIHGSFYDILHQMGIELYKDGKLTTAHYAPVDVIPALIRCLYAGTPHADITVWEKRSYAI